MTGRLPSLNALKAFEAAARLESISQAAEQLSVTHGAISRQIRTLEDELGVALFEKAGRGVRLTPAGKHLRDGSREAFDLLRATCAEIAELRAGAPFCWRARGACWRAGLSPGLTG